MTTLSPAPVVGVFWVWRLRWLVSLTHALLVVVTVALGGPVAWPVVGGVLAVGLASNVILGRWARTDRSLPPWVLGAFLAVDVGLLTVLLLFTGGVTNPFTFLYLLQLVVAAMVLEPVGVWSLVAIGALGYGSLFVLAPADPHAHHREPSAMNAHFLGMWIAFAISAPFAAFAVTRVRRALAEATAKVEEARRLEERNERLTALGTLAAGAAHELATPLSTIAVVAGDLLRHEDREVADDAGVIRSQVDKCRAVLAQLAADSGQRVGQRPRPITGAALAAQVLQGVDADHVVATVQPEAADRTVVVPDELIAQAARQLIANALDASPGKVQLRVEVAGDGLQLVVSDSGSGMTPEILARATEPFFTTKPEGAGTGLGLHFVRSIAEQVGGSLHLASAPDQGTRATLVLPGQTG